MVHRTGVEPVPKASETFVLSTGLTVHVCFPHVPKGGIWLLLKKKLRPVGTAFLVGVTGIEPATSCSQSTRAPSCATPRRYLISTTKIILY